MLEFCFLYLMAHQIELNTYMIDLASVIHVFCIARR